MWTVVIACCVLGYLFGSFPAGYLAGRLAGVDIQNEGSGNIGATNAIRVLGKRWGIPVLVIDIFKGFAAVRIALYLAGNSPAAKPYAEYLAILSAILCVVGHSFPVWLRFKGGKGVATSAGVMFGLFPLAVPFALVIWYVVFEISRYVSLASIAAAISLPIIVALFAHWGFIDTSALTYFAIAAMLLVLWRHRSNFSRLLNGTEQRFSRK
ncbi:MAG TPA: glycerol-3-phosphate 1-O-acyltransferase PlsY [Chthoniobacterales bacterium]